MLYRYDLKYDTRFNPPKPMYVPHQNPGRAMVAAQVQQSYGIGVAGLVIAIIAVILAAVAGGMYWNDCYNNKDNDTSK